MALRLRRSCFNLHDRATQQQVEASTSFTVDTMLSFPQPSLLTLRLSGTSFLDTVITDRSGPLYAIETRASTTSLFRCGHGVRDTSQGEYATISWPTRLASKDKQDRSPTVSIGGWFGPAGDFLLPSRKLSCSRKFHIPGHRDALKWRPVDGHYECRVSSKPSTLVATFEPAILTAAARIQVFVPSLVMDDVHPQHSYGSVSSHLLDYLILSALLLVTRPDEWTTLLELSVRSTPTPISTEFDSPFHNNNTPPISPITPTTVLSSPVSTVNTIPSPYILPPQIEEPYIPTIIPYKIPTRATSLRSNPHPPAPRRSATTGIVSRAYDYEYAGDEKKKWMDAEPPPPYEEIEWTTRVGRGKRLY